MHTLPQLIEEDVQQFDAALGALLAQSHATAAAIADKGGFLIAHQGGDADLDLTSIAALASGAFMATQSIAGLIREGEFNNTCQQGKDFSLFIQNIDEYSLLIVILPASAGVGAVKYFAADATRRIAQQIKTAAQRDPSAGLDLSVLNLADASALFRKR